MGFAPRKIDLSQLNPEDLRDKLGLEAGRKISVLSVCPPCTGFSRANPENHIRDDPRNGLVKRAADFATALDADVIVMENARELLRGNFSDHFKQFRQTIESSGYNVSANVYLLTRFGLPQIRERAIVIAAKKSFTLRTLDDLWNGFEVAENKKTVRGAFESIPLDSPGIDAFPSIADCRVMDRLSAIPKDGGSWIELLSHPNADVLMTPAMKRLVARQKFGSHPDVYGRMWWNRPAPTIKRECAHIGNGRYAHPSENRLCSVREMASLQGFPHDFKFVGTSLANQYRHIGDAVPPIVSFQIAHVCEWILAGRRKLPEDCLLPATHLDARSIIRAEQTELLAYA
jgi:DNA (cytosine-5)-methyltransferase 1